MKVGVWYEVTRTSESSFKTIIKRISNESTTHHDYDQIKPFNSYEVIMYEYPYSTFRFVPEDWILRELSSLEVELL